MSRPQYGNDMERPSAADIIRRARERAEAGLPREDYNTFLQRQAAMKNETPNAPSIPPRSRPPMGPQTGNTPRQQRPQAPPGFQNKDGQITLPISRPEPIPQWPLPGPIASPASSSDSEPYRPPAGSQPPQRPPRPSEVPSILDGSRIQDPTPVFQYQPQYSRDSETISSSIPETPSTLSRPSTLSSVGSIPDFPLPIQAPPPPPPPPVGPPRRSVNLGPPPSARRGASSFYSHLSYVSPIPEESDRSRSHASYASSAAMPESWGTPSPVQSPLYGDAFYDDTIVEESSPSEAHSMQDYGDESRLVRSASIGRRGKAALVTTGSREPTGDGGEEKRPSPTPMQPSPFNEGTGYLEASSNSSTTVPSSKSSKPPPVGAALTADDILNAYDAASAVDSRTSRRMSASSQPPPPAPLQPRAYSRLSAIRRPPRLDIDAVRDAEARGSLTSLPDLIRRATRLAASLDRGKRPASRLNDLDDFPVEFYGAGTKSANVDKESDEYYDNHQSGFSDMLAAFPPPAQAQSRQGGLRQSIRDSVMSWPLPPLNRNNNNNNNNNNMNNNSSPRGAADDMSSSTDSTREKKGRRCCGLPLWGFITIVIIVIILIAAAVIIPIEFFVVRRQNVNTQAEAEQQCQRQVTCQNGGTNVVINGFCSCICINNFTGFDCSVADNIGCTTATISGDTNISNVTVGNALPRLIAQAQTNFSVPLSGTTILSKLNAGNLSCSAENALVTLNGQSTVLGASAEAVTDMTGGSFDVVNAIALQEAKIATITVMAGQSTTTTLTIEISDTPATSSAAVPTTLPTTTITITRTFTSSWPPPSFTPAPTTSSSVPSLVTPSSVPTSVPPSATNPSSAFTVTNEVLDFARVGILFVLQQDSVADASTAQTALQSFLSSSSATITSASNVTLSPGNSIDLVNFRVDAGTGLVGSRNSATVRRAFEEEMERELWDRDWMP